ncbi:acyl-CoA thioester hydrolase/BAAT C-terminal domain-containing protein [Fulvivirga ligni]|uniref:acyl-CoA thioester hydrolase/BAAT C-terminal domain-containing protein n=1 Tax=Fulvivirga ligni TaxID=2904246 RepID=UPI001F409E3F|nr:acyl-CoA thioester hydrolase/BAAT C-terminal domain-containing protein [Fulvivirga ligni]UII19571.1 palmitoyl-CoA hydrolase [Fulvivirga ligni]
MKILVKIIIVIAILIGAYFLIDSFLFDGVKPQSVNHKGITASFFAKDDVISQPTVVLIGGGVWGDFWGQELSKANYVGLSLPYYRQEGLPTLMEEIPLEYFETAIKWLKDQPEVNADKIVVMGASRNAELALLIASKYPNLVHGVISYSPSAVSWSNTVLPFNSDTIKPSWTFDNQPIPYIPMAKLKGGKSDTIETLTYWSQPLADSASVSRAVIHVEDINGPVLLFSGVEDEVWPSAMMADMIETRVKKIDSSFDIENVQYENAGHLISSNPNNPSSMRQGEMMIDGKSYNFRFGGNEGGDMKAQKDAYQRVFKFLSKLEKK